MTLALIGISVFIHAGWNLLAHARRADGIYEANLAVPLAGRWFIRARITRNGESIHVIDEVDVRP